MRDVGGRNAPAALRLAQDAERDASDLRRHSARCARASPSAWRRVPSRDGSEVVPAVADRVRAEFVRRVGLDDLLAPVASL